MDATSVRDKLAAEDERPDIRQFTVADCNGGSAAYSEVDCVHWFGHPTGHGYTVAGNMLAGRMPSPQWLQPLGRRLVSHSRNGWYFRQGAGGDRRGRQSAALKILDTEDYHLIDIRVDDHPDPVTELRRIWELHNQGFDEVMRMKPTKAHPAGPFDLNAIRRLLPD